MRETNGGAASFLGGLNVRNAKGRRFGASVPFARLTVTPDAVELRCVGPLRRLPGRTAARAEVRECYRLRPVPPFVHGVGFALGGDEVAYFWTFRPRAVLRVLAAYGYPEGPPRWPPLRHYLGLRP